MKINFLLGAILIYSLQNKIITNQSLETIPIKENYEDTFYLGKFNLKDTLYEVSLGNIQTKDKSTVLQMTIINQGTDTVKFYNSYLGCCLKKFSHDSIMLPQRETKVFLSAKLYPGKFSNTIYFHTYVHYRLPGGMMLIHFSGINID